MHPQFFEFIRIAREHGHQVFFASNGYNYSRPKFMRELSAIDEIFVAGLSIDGGTTQEKYYEILNNRACLETKLKALENLRACGIRRVCLSAIITRGVNESVIGELLTLADEYSDIVRYIHFRSAAMVGRWADTLPYTQAELIDLMRPHFTEQQMNPSCLREIFCTKEEGGECCFRFRPTRRLQISLIEFATEKSSRCPKRGKLSMDNFTIQPFFENMMKVGDELTEQFGEVVVGAN
jgi:molybdenum cofactor biosynthesis enzyme MoaA